MNTTNETSRCDWGAGGGGRGPTTRSSKCQHHESLRHEQTQDCTYAIGICTIDSADLYRWQGRVLTPCTFSALSQHMSACMYVLQQMTGALHTPMNACEDHGSGQCDAICTGMQGAAQPACLCNLINAYMSTCNLVWVALC